MNQSVIAAENTGKLIEQTAVCSCELVLGPAAEARIPETCPLRLITYGRYVQKKGFDLLLRSFADMVAGGVDAVLTIGGSGPEEAALKQLALELGIAEKVSLGVLIDNVAVALDQADVFVLPSLDEPFGIVMLEAMARGLPVVTTRTQGPSQVLTDQTAFFAETGSVESLTDALKAVAADPVLAGAKASAALELYRTTYYEDAVLPKLEALYQSVRSR